MTVVVGRQPKPSSDLSEAKILQSIRLALGSIADSAFWRNNTGVAYFDRPVKYGLGNGSADLIGTVAGRFCALEVKTGRGFLSVDQANWLELVRNKGGFAAVVRSPEEAIAAVERCRKGARE